MLGPAVVLDVPRLLAMVAGLVTAGRHGGAVVARAAAVPSGDGSIALPGSRRQSRHHHSAGGLARSAVPKPQSH